MSTTVCCQLAGWDRVRDALEEIQACGHEADAFFADVCGELESLGGDLTEKNRLWESQRQHAEQTLRRQYDDVHNQAAQLQQQIDELKQRQDDLAVERRDLEQLRLARTESDDNEPQGPWLEQFLADAREDRAELRMTQRQVQEQLARLAAVSAELAETRRDMAEHARQPGSDAHEATAAALRTYHEELAGRLEKIEQQQADLRDQRDTIESKLETVGSRAGELGQLLAEQKQWSGRAHKDRETTAAALEAYHQEVQQRLEQIEQQQAALHDLRDTIETKLETVGSHAGELGQLLAEQKQWAGRQDDRWTGELTELRALLGRLAERLAEAPAAPPPPEPLPAEQPAHNGDPMLESVASQFELLRRNQGR